ncbi:MAG: amidohydrolase family protein [Gammaproteobacteria bacterium]
MSAVLAEGCISADSHVVEGPDTYTRYIDAKYRDRAPHIESDAAGNDIYVIPGMSDQVPLGLVAAAGVPARELKSRRQGCKFGDLHRSGYDSTLRVADQQRDGVAGEILFASVGMVLCNHPDFDYKDACFKAYNRWLQEYCAVVPERLFGLAQTAVKSVDSAVEDVRRAKEMGFVGMMMPGNPQHEDYDQPLYDPLWEACTALEMPVCFHILTSKGSDVNSVLQGARGNKMNGFMNIIRGIQDIVGLFVLGGVFERHPALRMVCAEGDAGWLPHYMYRMDHAYDRHGYHMDARGLPRYPSEYIRENIYFTFQDDWVAFKCVDQLNPRRLIWANDFPHSDATWPHSQGLLAEHTACVSEEQRRWILRDNVKELFNLPC